MAIAFGIAIILGIGTGCQDKKPNAKLANADTVNAPISGSEKEGIESIVNADSIVAAGKKNRTSDVADTKKAKLLAAKEAKEAEKAEKTSKTKELANAKTNAKPAVKPTKPAAIPADKAMTKTDKFPDDANVIKRNGRDGVLRISEAKPAFPGGEEAMMKFLNKNIKYPNRAKEDGIQGTVFIRFVVEKDGVVDDVEVAKGVSPLLDSEAKRVVASMPKWAAGRQKGQPVAVQYTLPVRFELLD